MAPPQADEVDEHLCDECELSVDVCDCCLVCGLYWCRCPDDYEDEDEE